MTWLNIQNNSNNMMPSYATEGSAGFDLRSNEEGVLKPGERRLFKTGLVFEVPFGYEAQIRPRSGLAYKHGITVLNSPGTIDSDYRGDVGVILINHGDKDFKVELGDRIAQCIIAQVGKADIRRITELTTTERGDGGFGHTGTK